MRARERERETRALGRPQNHEFVYENRFFDHRARATIDTSGAFARFDVSSSRNDLESPNLPSIGGSRGKERARV